MSTARVHYNPDLGIPYPIRTKNRVSKCGVITVHSTPQKYVIETSEVANVTCKLCLKHIEQQKLT